MRGNRARGVAEAILPVSNSLQADRARARQHALSRLIFLFAAAGMVVGDGGHSIAGDLHPERFNLLSTTSEEVDAFLDEMRDAVQMSDFAGFANLVEVPLNVGLCDGERTVKGSEELRSIYGELIDENLRQAILEQSVRDLAVSWQGMMIASGRLWFTVLCDRESEPEECVNRRIRIIRINYNCNKCGAMKTFDQLYEELQEYRETIDVMVSSRTEDHNDCDAFREIVARGEEFLPRVVEEIEKGDFFLNQAMEEITGLNIFEIYPDERVVGAQDTSRLWVRWWKSRTRTPPPEAGSSDSG